MRNLDFSSWQAVLSTLLGLALVTLVVVGIRLLVMQTVQHGASARTGRSTSGCAR